MSVLSPLDALNLEPFQKRTARYVHERMFKGGQKRFLIADEVGLGKTKVAQGVIALATARRPRANVLYVASSGHIVGQNLAKLRTGCLRPETHGSLSELAELVYCEDVQGRLIGLTPIKDLRGDHFGSARERALLYRLLKFRHPTLMDQSGMLSFFCGRVNEQTFLSLTTKRRVSLGLSNEFERHLDDELIGKLANPQQRDRHKRDIVGKLRAVLARCALDKLNPALVIVDEIQKFSDQLFGNSPTPQVSFLLKRSLLVLSATPYQPGAPGDHRGPDPQKGFIELVGFLNHRRPERTARVKSALAEMREALLETEIRETRVTAAVGDLAAHLRDFMVRTERPFDAHVKRSKLEPEIKGAELAALRQTVRLLERAKPSARNRQHRYPELVELWKSTPYIVSSIDERYVTGRGIAEGLKNTGRRPPAPAALTTAQLRRNVALGEAAHPRLRSVQKAMGSDAQERRLWLPPTLPYIANLSRASGPQPSKTLIFTSWRAAPPAIATALNLLVEPKPGLEKNLEFSRTNKQGRSEPSRSVYVLAAPLWRFAEKSDPFRAVRESGRALTVDELIAAVRLQLVKSQLITVTPAAKKETALDAVLSLNAGAPLPMFHRRELSYMGPVRELMQQVLLLDKASVRSPQGNDLAEFAAAAPGTCAYRALRSAIPPLANEKDTQAQSTLFVAALTIGNTITRLFQRRAAVAIVEASRWNRKAPYWRRVLRFCLEHDLQSVLDEYVFLLVRDSAERDPHKLAHEVAAVFELALRTVGGLQVVRPKPKKDDAPYGAAMYARALGEHGSMVDDDLKAASKAAAKKKVNAKGATKNAVKDVKKKLQRAKGWHADPLLTAFNSPFPPFVLATTSTGQEGLDMHRYCRRLVHWNLPTSPLALEQREGRVDRYLSLGVRTNIATLSVPQAQPYDNAWAMLVKEATEQTDQHQSVLAPLWHFGNDQPIEALAVNIPYSREEAAWERLQEEASWYRLVLGQPDPHSLLERLSNSSEGNRLAIKGVRLNLAPPQAGATCPHLTSSPPVAKRGGSYGGKTLGPSTMRQI